jgi:hypothetical protein
MLDYQFKYRYSRKLVSDFQAVSSPAALCPLTGAVGGAVTGIIVLGALNGANQFGLFHSAGRNAKILGLVLYLTHCHWSLDYFYRSHAFLLFNCVVV